MSKIFKIIIVLLMFTFLVLTSYNNIEKNNVKTNENLIIDENLTTTFMNLQGNIEEKAQQSSENYILSQRASKNYPKALNN